MVNCDGEGQRQLTQASYRSHRYVRSCVHVVCTTFVNRNSSGQLKFVVKFKEHSLDRKSLHLCSLGFLGSLFLGSSFGFPGSSLLES